MLEPQSLALPVRIGALLAVLLVARASEAEPGKFAKGPYLQGLGQTEVTIQLELEEPPTEPASVEIIGPDGDRRTMTGASGDLRAFQAIQIDGLSPSTLYRYAAIAGGARSDEGRFTTAPADNRPFRFVLYGDSRTDHATHAAVIRAIEAVPSDLLVHTGDMVAKGNNPDDWRALFDAERTLLRDRCVFASVGNHELTAPDPAGEVSYLRYFGGDPTADLGAARAHLHRSFRWSNTRFFLLNAMDSWTGEERRWLREELARSDNETGLVHRIAVLHHGPFSSGRHGPNKRMIDGNVVEIMREHRMSLVLSGHDHIYERGEGQGLKYIVSGGAGAPLYARGKVAPESQTFESVHHFVEFAIDGELVEVTARRASGAVLERCSFRGLQPWICTETSGGSSSEGAGKAGAKDGEGGSGSSCACAVVGQPSSRTGGPGGPGGEASAPLVLGVFGACVAAVFRRACRASVQRKREPLDSHETRAIPSRPCGACPISSR